MAPDHWKARWYGVEREFAALESDTQRREVWQKATRDVVMKVWFRAACANVLVVLVLLYPLSIGLDFVQRHSALPRLVIFFLCFMVLPRFFFPPVDFLVKRRPIQRAVRKRARELGIPICPDCGYHLAGLPDSRCPECGHTAPPAVPVPATPHDNGTLCPCPRCKERRSMQPG